MKKILIIISLLFFIPMIAQKQKAILFFKDGTELKGLAKITANEKIKFRKNERAKKTYYTSNDLDSIKIRVLINAHLGKTKAYSNSVFYFFKKVKGYKFYKLLELIEKGKLMLYRDLKEVRSPGIPVSGGYGKTVKPFWGPSYTINNYFVTKSKNDSIMHLGRNGYHFNTKFIKTASDYFKDCSALTNKIKIKEYKKQDIVEIVKFYNTKCVNK